VSLGRETEVIDGDCLLLMLAVVMTTGNHDSDNYEQQLITIIVWMTSMID